MQSLSDAMTNEGRSGCRLRMRFSLAEEADLSTVEEELAMEIADLARRTGVTGVRVKEGNVGVGASGPGFELIIELARTAVDDTGRLAALGGWVMWLIERAQARKRRVVTISDEATLGAVAAAVASKSCDLASLRFLSCRPLTGWPATPDETDERFIWTAVFANDAEHEVLVVFMSPAGVVLGQVVVPEHAYESEAGWMERSQDDLAERFRRRNGHEYPPSMNS